MQQPAHQCYACGGESHTTRALHSVQRLLQPHTHTHTHAHARTHTHTCTHTRARARTRLSHHHTHLLMAAQVVCDGRGARQRLVDLHGRATRVGKHLGVEGEGAGGVVLVRRAGMPQLPAATCTCTLRPPHCCSSAPGSAGRRCSTTVRNADRPSTAPSSLRTAARPGRACCSVCRAACAAQNCAHCLQALNSTCTWSTPSRSMACTRMSEPLRGSLP